MLVGVCDGGDVTTDWGRGALPRGRREGERRSYIHPHMCLTGFLRWRDL